MNKKSIASAKMGGSLIIVIFVVLCLTVFSVLSFTTAYSDLKLTKKTEKMAADYYFVHGKAEQKCSEIYDELIAANNEIIESSNIGSIRENFYNAATENLKNLSDIEITSNNADDYNVYFESAGNENQKICVTMYILYDEENKMPYYTIKSWNLSNINTPVYDDSNIDLWEGVFENENN